MAEWRILTIAMSEPKKVTDAISMLSEAWTDCEIVADLTEIRVVRDAWKQAMMTKLCRGDVVMGQLLPIGTDFGLSAVTACPVLQTYAIFAM